MYKLIIIIFLFSFINPIHGQMPTDGDYSDWDWEDMSNDNWKIKIGSNWIEINPPFSPNSERVGKIVDVYETSDYTNNKGWELIWAQFDGIYPYFILYNAHKGTIRSFFYLHEQPFSHVLATLSYHDINNPGILTYGNEFQVAADKYLDGSILSDDMISVIIPFQAPHTWSSADFPLVFDKNITNSKYDSKKWVFKYYGCENYQIHLKGETGNASTEQHTITGKKSDIAGNTFSATHAKLHKQLESNDKFMQQMQTSVNNINSESPEYLRDYKTVVQDLKPIADIFSATVGISSGVGAVLGFLKVITGSFDNQESTPPNAVIQLLELDGTMDIELDLGVNTLKIPGVNGDYFPPVPWSPFDCPLGYINLEETPTIKKTTAYEKFGFEGSFGVIWKDNIPLGEPLMFLFPDIPTYVLADGAHPSVNGGYLGTFVKYKFEDDIKISLNELPGLSLIDIHFVLFVKLTGTGNDQFLIEKKFIDCSFELTNGQSIAVPVLNPIYEYLNEGRYKIYKFDKESNEIYFGTPELPMNQLKDIIIEVPESSDVSLRVIAKFKSDNYIKPIIFQANYNLNVQEEEAESDRIWWHQDQTNFPWSDYYGNDFDFFKITLTNINSNQYLAGSIILKPGFNGIPGFNAKAVDIYPTRGNTQLNYYQYDCDDEVEDSSTKSLNEDVNEEYADNKFKIYPNPNNGVFSISHTNTFKHLLIYDIKGSILLEKTIPKGSLQTEVSLNNAGNSGILFVKLIGDKEVIIRKLILEK